MEKFGRSHLWSYQRKRGCRIWCGNWCSNQIGEFDWPVEQENLKNKAPSWVRLVRAGTEFSFHHSCRGVICSFCAKVARRRFPQQLPIAEPDCACDSKIGWAAFGPADLGDSLAGLRRTRWLCYFLFLRACSPRLPNVWIVISRAQAKEWLLAMTLFCCELGFCTCFCSS